MSESPKYYALRGPSIIVDDSDPTIRYNGTWNGVNETVILGASFAERMPVLNTLHVLQIFSGSFSYDFTGGGISVFATPFDNSTYTSDCFLDGNRLDFDPNAAKPQFGQSRPVCQAFGLPDNTVHTISVVVSVPPRRNQQDTSGPLSGFAFDYMLIQPPSDMSPWINGTEDIFLPVLDVSVILNSTQPTANFSMVLGNEPAGQMANFSRAWTFDPENGFQTSTQGSQSNVTFTGTSLWWYGYFKPSDMDLAFASVTFSVDGGPPSTFFGSGFTSSLPSSQALLFKTPVLQYSTHLLTVVHHGTNATLPLTLQSLVVQRSIPTVSVRPTPTVGSAPSSTISNPPTSHLVSKRGGRGGIIGGVAGGAAFLLLVLSGIYLVIRWTRKRRHSAHPGTISTTVVPEPFHAVAEETDRILSPRKVQLNGLNMDNPFTQPLQSPPLTKWTRRHTVSAIPRSMLSSPTAGIPEQGLPGSRISLPPNHAASQFYPEQVNTVIEHPVTQIGNAHANTASDTIYSNSNLPIVRGARQEDSGIRTSLVVDPPPLYTTH